MNVWFSFAHDFSTLNKWEIASNVRVHLFEQLNEHNLILNYLECELKYKERFSINALKWTSIHVRRNFFRSFGYS